MKIRSWLAGVSCVLLLCSLSACSMISPQTGDTTTTAPTTTTTKAVRTTTALPSTGYIHGHAASVRSGAGLSYKAIGGVQLGEEIIIVGKQGDWYEIQFGDNETGFVSGQFVRFTPWDPNTTTQAESTATTTAAENTTSTDIDE